MDPPGEILYSVPDVDVSMNLLHDPSTSRPLDQVSANCPYTLLSGEASYPAVGKGRGLNAPVVSTSAPLRSGFEPTPGVVQVRARWRVGAAEVGTGPEHVSKRGCTHAKGQTRHGFDWKGTRLQLNCLNFSRLTFDLSCHLPDHYSRSCGGRSRRLFLAAF